MTSLKRWTAGAVFGFACGSAGAGLHQICYEGPPQFQGSRWVSTVIAGCALDSAGSCTIAPSTTDLTRRSSASPLDQGVQSTGTFAYFDARYSVSPYYYEVKVRFFDSNGTQIDERPCQVSTVGTVTGAPTGQASPGALLTGFSTDVSGRVTTGVWQLTAPTDAPWRRMTVKVPGDFVAVGGGAMGVETPIGALIMQSTRANIPGDVRSWQVGTSEAGGAAQAHRTTAYVIGMRIRDVEPATLVSLLEVATATSPRITSTPVAQTMQSVIGGNVILSGGIDAAADSSNAGNLIGQFATQSAPVIGDALGCTEVNGIFQCIAIRAATGWRVASKDHVISHPGTVSVKMLALPTAITITTPGSTTTWEVRGGFVSATSAVAAHPAIDVGGLRGEYALTGIGATSNWRPNKFGDQLVAGNLLWKLQPRADLGGASVAAKDHIISSPASITGYALGIKLVPVGSP